MNTQPQAPDTILTVENLCVRFGGLTALNGVSLRVAPGSLAGLIGPNGAGKTTVFNTITGLYTPTSGSLYLNGQRLVGLKSHTIARLGVARTFQNIRLFSGLSVLDNLLVARSLERGFWAKVLGLPQALRQDKALLEEAHHWLEFVGLMPWASHSAVSLPYGSQRKLEIARAMMAKPQLLLLDEPAAGMNPSEKLALTQVVERIAAQGLAILLIEHDMKFVMSLCKQVTVLDHGEVIASGTPEEVQGNPQVIEAYLGVRVDHKGTSQGPVQNEGSDGHAHR